MHISLQQWQAFVAVVEQGGYAKASEALNKSQSSVSYNVSRLETQLGLRLFKIEGRKSVLTSAGEQMLLRAKHLLKQATNLEQVAKQLANLGKPEVVIAMDTIFPTELIFEVLAKAGETEPLLRVQLLETVLGGTDEALMSREVDLAISTHVPAGFMGQHLMRVEFIAVAAPSHPLHKMTAPISFDNLRDFRQLVVRDSGLKFKREAGAWLEAQQRWTVSHITSAITAVRMGQGFGWYPKALIAKELAAGELKPLPLAKGDKRYADVYLIIAEGDMAAPQVLDLAARLQSRVCAKTI
ncbi:LysR family transcriptional regulator [Marinospirillum insulare]|uniref:Transcriptional regulator n=1 Tax=Marinospirillum insulare TaxID=217169 RepID=A0ABQ5ZWE3_9GAMM|nr:LysR family transcriptional regulator [Marinospirillum insulare]GLR64479.1 transcriptional regulator [Marinospirillum insulare]